MAAARLIDATALPVYDLGQDHPFARDRQLPLFDLLRTHGLIHDHDLLPTRPATDAELQTVHDAAYIELLKATSEPHPDPAVLRRAPLFGLGTADNPIAVGQHASAAATAGATLACVDAVLDGTCRAAFNPAGGLHHAMPHGAAGFCLYNDLAIGIRRARDRGLARVLYVDLDVHHGDGVEFAFRSDPSVLTISFHETPEIRFPFTGRIEDQGAGAGFGYAVNVPLWPATADDSWLECVERVLVPLARAFEPDLIVSQHGCDPHREDPLATIECTTRAFWESAKLVRTLANDLCQGRWVATGGGGYRPYHVIPRAWAMVWCAMAGRELPETIDAGWRARWQKKAGDRLPDRMFDQAEPAERHARAAAVNRRTVDALLARIPWLEGRNLGYQPGRPG
jgi:acetoin utilization protein AcuC